MNIYVYILCVYINRLVSIRLLFICILVHYMHTVFNINFIMYMR